MKKVTKLLSILTAVIVILLIVVLYLWLNPKIRKVNVPLPVNNKVLYVPEIRKSSNVPEFRQPLNVPEFRGPPIKKYKPGHTQQMGVLINSNKDIIPLYGKETRSHRDRFNYYTTTGGENLYPLPVSHKGRDCTDDNGCEELYNNEKVTVLGKNGEYTVNVYKTDNF
jgi:hypothetical protein